jgi:hypothetical protein
VGVPVEIVRARETGRPVRIHTAEGEDLVARVLAYDDAELVYAALTSSFPERYGICDATGFSLSFDAIRSVELLDAEPDRPFAGPARG